MITNGSAKKMGELWRKNLMSADGYRSADQDIMLQ